MGIAQIMWHEMKVTEREIKSFIVMLNLNITIFQCATVYDYCHDNKEVRL